MIAIKTELKGASTNTRSLNICLLKDQTLLQLEEAALSSLFYFKMPEQYGYGIVNVNEF